MKALAVLAFALAGCAQILGLDQTTFDGGTVDAPSVCDGAPACTSTTGRSVCGQLFGTGAAANGAFRVATFTGDKCDVTNTEGPCGLAVAAYPLTTYFDGTRTGKVDGQIDDCGRFVVGDVDATVANVAVEFTGTNFQTTATLVLGRETMIGEDLGVTAYAVSTDTTATWSTQMAQPPPAVLPETTTGYMIQYTRASSPVAGEQVTADGMGPFGTNSTVVPWAGYFAAGSVFGILDPTLTSTTDTGTAFSVLPSGTFGLEGVHVGGRCTTVPGLQQVPATLIYVHLDPRC